MFKTNISISMQSREATLLKESLIFNSSGMLKRKANKFLFFYSLELVLKILNIFI